MDQKRIEELARGLWEAERTGNTLPPYTENGCEDMTLDDAYAIQLAAVEMKKADGFHVVGKKVGLTNAAVRKARGIPEPDYGHIMNNVIGNQDVPYRYEELTAGPGTHPALECELAFILKEDLTGPGITAARVAEAAEGVVPAIEIVERRFYPLCSNVKDSICDNAACGRIILGAKLSPVKGLDLRTIGLLVEKNGLPIDYSCSAAVLGSPAESVAWLANKLAAFGVSLRAGEIVMSGSIGAMHEINAGDCFTAHFGDGLGSVKAVFI